MKNSARPIAVSVPSSVEALYLVATTYAGLGEFETMQAQAASRKAAENHWRKAQGWYALSAKTWSLIMEPGIASPNGFDVVPVAAVNEALSRCAAALQQDTRRRKQS